MEHDIHKVCQTLGTTSRTLRYYEEMSLITCEKNPFTSRRRFTDEQLEQARYVLMLRNSGLSIKRIRALQKQDITLKEAVLLCREEASANIHNKSHELSKLNDLLLKLESEHSSSAAQQEVSLSHLNKIANVCYGAILSEDIDTLYSYFSPKLTAYLPKAVYCKIWNDIRLPLGGFVDFEKRWWDTTIPHTVYQQFRFEKTGLCVKLVFCDHIIDGIWMDTDT